MSPEETYLYTVMAAAARNNNGFTDADMAELLPRIGRSRARITIKVVGDGAFGTSVEAVFEAERGQSPDDPGKFETIWMPVELVAHG